VVIGNELEPEKLFVMGFNVDSIGRPDLTRL